MKLARRIILLSLSTFLLLLGVLGAFEVRSAVRKYDARAAVNLTLMGRALRSTVTEVRRTEGDARASDVLLQADKDLSEVKLRAVPLAAAKDSTDLSEAQVAALSRGEEVTLERGPPSAGIGEDQLFVYVPLDGLGAIELSQDLAEERAIMARVLYDRLEVGLAATFAAVILSLVAGVSVVGKPVSSLVKQARRIGGGDLSQRLPTGRKDEIGELAREMNSMCDLIFAANEKAAAEADARVRAVDQLRHADRLRTVGSLASGIAHELGTPLSVVAGRAKMISNPECARADAEEYGRVILGQAQRMTTIVRGLLDFARQRPSQRTDVDLREVARRAADLLAPLAKKRSVSIHLEIPDEPAIASVDIAQAEQALTNIVVNGVHSMNDGGDLNLTVKRETHAHPDGGEGAFVRIDVADKGSGIPKEHLGHVFEPFFTTKEVGEGTGLGLSITYGIMKEHGGFIDVESEVGRGSRFSLFFPEKMKA